MKKLIIKIKNGMTYDVICILVFSVMLIGASISSAWSLTSCAPDEEVYRLLIAIVYNVGAYIGIHIAKDTFKKNLSSKEEP